MTEHKRVLRYEVPVDDREHAVRLPGYSKVLHVASRESGVVEFWAEVIESWEHYETRLFRVFGTGHPVPLTGWYYAGTTLDQHPALVWHLYEKKEI